MLIPCKGFFKILWNIVNGWKPLTIFTKSFILDIWQGSEYNSANQVFKQVRRYVVTWFIWTWFLNKRISSTVYRLARLDKLGHVIMRDTEYQCE